MTAPVIVWFRRNLRLADNPALLHAIAEDRPLIAVYISGDDGIGSASRWWLHHSLDHLQKELRKLDSDLWLFRGQADDILARIVAASGAESLHYSRSYLPGQASDDDSLSDALDAEIDVRGHEDYYLQAPGTVLNQTGEPYKVFTPFWNACTRIGDPAQPDAMPSSIPALPRTDAQKLEEKLQPLPLSALELLPRHIDWADGFREQWQPGEAGALLRLQDYVHDVGEYPDLRDRPDIEGTSKLSPHLHFGEVSPKQVWDVIRQATTSSKDYKGAESYLRQLYWRDFSGHLLFHFPSMLEQPLRPEFRDFPWREDDDLLAAWQQGLTGFPLVDAGMRQLWHTGWMHNRVRMIVASLLAKNLLLDWRSGADWFMDTLVDADPANNYASWQWVAGCGTDAAPYFRIFNPILQSRKFDPDGVYIRQWLPELANLPNKHLHCPSQADAGTLASAGVRLGADYPHPVVDLHTSRERALSAYHEVRSLVQSPAARPGSSAG